VSQHQTLVVAHHDFAEINSLPGFELKSSPYTRRITLASHRRVHISHHTGSLHCLPELATCLDLCRLGREQRWQRVDLDVAAHTSPSIGFRNTTAHFNIVGTETSAARNRRIVSRTMSLISLLLSLTTRSPTVVVMLPPSTGTWHGGKILDRGSPAPLGLCSQSSSLVAHRCRRSAVQSRGSIREPVRLSLSRSPSRSLFQEVDDLVEGQLDRRVLVARHRPICGASPRVPAGAQAHAVTDRVRVPRLDYTADACAGQANLQDIRSAFRGGLCGDQAARSPDPRFRK
jgi:hypothetical protein